MSSAELSLLVRIDGLERQHVHDALWKQRSLVKLWATRGTLHLLPSSELGLWLSAFGTYTNFGNAGRDDIDELARAVGQALKGKVLTREELADEVERITGSATYAEWARHSWGAYFKAASFRGLICFGPNNGNNVRFTSPVTWVPGGIRRMDSVEALREITRRFLAAYAPATPKDLTRWWAGPPQKRKGSGMIRTLGDDVVEVDIDGTTAWALAKDVDDMARTEPSNTARLIPAFDPWVIGASRRDPFLDPHYAGRVYRKQGWISPVLLVNGRASGVWKHQRKGRRLLIEIEPFERIPVWARKQVELEAERIARFHDGALELRYVGCP
jgi:uncharacterized protein YcaQ